MSDEKLPAIFERSEDIITGLTQLVGVPREMLPAKDQIDNVLKQLPSLLADIRQDLRDEKIAKMCIAVGVGLFDSAVNYVWNQTVIEIRKRIITFGLDVVKQLKNKDYTEQDIDGLQDSQLLDLAHELNLINDEGYYFLNQCRDIRNNFSAAHPSIGEMDNYELVGYINRCIKYSLSTEEMTVGVDLKTLIATLGLSSYSDEQLEHWSQKIKQTHPAQKDAIITMLHGFYCDPSKQNNDRVNALNLSIKCKSDFNSKVISGIINQYEEYVGKNDEKKKKASEDFMIRVGLIDSLHNATRHSIISRLCSQMMTIHQGMNNFYNEPPFAEYLLLVSSQAEIPDTVKAEFVETVVSCAVGNEYGVSNAAVPFYDKIIQNFTPSEMEIMLKIPDGKSYTSYKVKKYPRCIYQYRHKVQLLNQTILPASLQPLYQSRLR